jgi:hypothetical protein
LFAVLSAHFINEYTTVIVGEGDLHDNFELSIQADIASDGLGHNLAVSEGYKAGERL